MRFSEKVAFLVTERRGLMWSVVVLIAISSVGILVAFLRLDTEGQQAQCIAVDANVKVGL